MPDARNLPSVMCPSCKHYEFTRGCSSPHRCNDCGSFTNSTKCGQSPDNDGTAPQCNSFAPR